MTPTHACTLYFAEFFNTQTHVLSAKNVIAILLRGSLGTDCFAASSLDYLFS